MTQQHLGHKSQAAGVTADWQFRRVGEMGDVLAGKALNVGGSGALRPYLRTKNVLDGRIALDDVLWMPMTDAEFARFRVIRGDVLLNEGQSLELVGRCSIYNDEFAAPCAMQNQLLRFRAYSGTSPQFAAHLFRYCQQNGTFSAIATQTTSVAHLGSSRFSNLRLLWPTRRKEQEAIAEALSKLDDQISTLERLIAKKQAIKQGIMQQLLTSKVRLPGFVEPWSQKTVRSIVATPVTDGPHSTPEFLSDGVPFLSVNNLVDGRIDWSDLRFISRKDHEVFSKKCRPQKGDVLLGKAASVGKVAYLDTDREVNIWSPIALIRAKSEYVSKFVYYQLQSRDTVTQIELLTNSSSQGNIGMGDIEKIVISLPRKQEQQAIAEVLSDVDQEIDILRCRLIKARSVKQGMVQELLTGRTRLPIKEATT